jgi:hypothetical protein
MQGGIQTPGREVRPAPAAPPVYKPQPPPKVLQTKSNLPAQGHAASQPGRTPAAPQAYRPQSTQHTSPGQNPSGQRQQPSGVSAHRPAAPPRHPNPGAHGSVQPKMTAAAQPHNPQRSLPVGQPSSPRQTQFAPPAAVRQPSPRPASQAIQRVKIADTHDLKNARRYVQWQAYDADPQVSQGGQHRLGRCYICGKYDFMNTMEVDHVVPEDFLRALLQLRGEDQPMAEDIAEVLQLDWKKTREYDYEATYNAFTGYRERYENVDKTSKHAFNGNLYEALYDVDNLKLICGSCNGKKIKSNRLLKVDYKALANEYQRWDKPGQARMQKFLGAWLGTKYYLNPNKVGVDYGSPPNSPNHNNPNNFTL